MNEAEVNKIRAEVWAEGFRAGREAAIDAAFAAVELNPYDGTCGDVRFTVDGGMPLVCSRPAFHDGDHRAYIGTGWTNEEES